jgi:micrococcal nuclease
VLSRPWSALVGLVAGALALAALGAIAVIAVVDAVRPAPDPGSSSSHATGPTPSGEALADRPRGPGGPPATVPDDAEAAVVDRVVDGDTIRVVAEPGGSIHGGGSIRVRLLNVDAPELGRDGSPPECLADAARDRLSELVSSGDLVWLVADERDRDRFERPLRGLWTDDGRFVNELLAAEGYAVALLVPPNDRFLGVVQAAEDRARSAGVGVWGPACAA